MEKLFYSKSEIVNYKEQSGEVLKEYRYLLKFSLLIRVYEISMSN